MQYQSPHFHQPIKNPKNKNTHFTCQSYIKENPMNDLDEYVKQKKAMGQRFKQFRELVGKSKKQMEQEANHPCIKEKKINQFEYGAIIPDIVFIQFFYYYRKLLYSFFIILEV